MNDSLHRPLLEATSRKERIRMRRQETYAASHAHELARRGSSSTITTTKEEKIEPPPQVKCILRTPHYPDELANILGDSELPYFGLFGNKKDQDTSGTQPTAEDRALFKHVHKIRPQLAPLEQDHPNRAQLSNVTIHFGQKYTMDAWYRSAYPAEYTRRDYMSVCCFCLDYSLSDLTAERHVLKCSRRFPPGREIYRDGKLSIWEVDGSHANLYCQNLCLLAKSFLSSKSLYRDVQPFFFYVLTELSDDGPRFVGYFSKQKLHSYYQPKDPIQCVSCIISLPFTQKQGYGQFLIDFSYLLTRTQRAIGGPETPLSSLGERAFKSYWRYALCKVIDGHISSGSSFTLSSLACETGITTHHVILTLEDLNWLKVSDEGKPKIVINTQQLNALKQKWIERKEMELRPEKLMWTPLFGE